MQNCMVSDRVLCHFCFKPKKVIAEALAVERAKKSQVLVSGIILLKTALDALPLLSKVPLPFSHPLTPESGRYSEGTEYIKEVTDDHIFC